LTQPGDVIVDPFVGTASWGKKAAAMGRRWIGASPAGGAAVGWDPFGDLMGPEKASNIKWLPQHDPLDRVGQQQVERARGDED
jgi:tRNA G10  N-methylase Trm11